MPQNSHSNSHSHSPSRRQAGEPGDNARAAAPAALDFWSEQARHQMECGLQNMVSLLHLGEELGQTQLQAAQQALERHRELLQRLQQAQDPSQLMQVQSEFWRIDTAAATRYWHDLFDAAMRMNAQLMRGQVDLLSTGRSEAVKTAFQTVQSTLNSGIRPLDGLFNMPGMQEAAAYAGRHH